MNLVLFVLGLRHLGAVRTAARFFLVPFIGAMPAVPMPGGPISVTLLAAGGLTGLGLWPRLAERHEHEDATSRWSTSTSIGTGRCCIGICTDPTCSIGKATGTHGEAATHGAEPRPPFIMWGDGAADRV